MAAVREASTQSFEEQLFELVIDIRTNERIFESSPSLPLNTHERVREMVSMLNITEGNYRQQSTFTQSMVGTEVLGAYFLSEKAQAELDAIRQRRIEARDRLDSFLECHEGRKVSVKSLGRPDTIGIKYYGAIKMPYVMKAKGTIDASSRSLAHSYTPNVLKLNRGRWHTSDYWVMLFDHMTRQPQVSLALED